MTTPAQAVVQATGLVHGHCECRFLDETVPVLSHVLALEVIDKHDKQVTMKHPNTGWLLIVHEAGPEARDKPERNHYGVRVSNNKEVDKAYEYLLANKERLNLKKVVKRKERAGSYSLFFVEPGGNYWEIESYENRAKAGLPEHVAYPWKTPLIEDQFPGRGYIPQAMTHGTVECVNLDASVKFYREGLGLDVITHVPTVRPHDIKHPSTPWYIASLEIPEKNRKYLTPLQRYTVTVDTTASLAKSHHEFHGRRADFGITAIETIKETQEGESFLLSDLDRNWWEIACLRN
jgi:catechol 2,3-dioxygenase-like lactoylglutathione lyase family enzyme